MQKLKDFGEKTQRTGRKSLYLTPQKVAWIYQLIYSYYIVLKPICNYNFIFIPSGFAVSAPGEWPAPSTGQWLTISTQRKIPVAGSGAATSLQSRRSSLEAQTFFFGKCKYFQVQSYLLKTLNHWMITIIFS